MVLNVARSTEESPKGSVRISHWLSPEAVMALFNIEASAQSKTRILQEALFNVVDDTLFNTK